MLWHSDSRRRRVDSSARDVTWQPKQCALATAAATAEGVASITRKLENCVGPVPTLCCGRPSDFWPFELKIGAQVLLLWETFTPILVFLCFLVSELRAQTRPADGQTSETRNAAYIRTAAVQQYNNSLEYIACWFRVFSKVQTFHKTH